MKRACEDKMVGRLQCDLSGVQRASLVVTITSHLRELVRSGALAAGTALPSCQELAKLWGVGYVTAHRALDQLSKEKLLVRYPKRGTIVADADQIMAMRTRRIGLLLMAEAREPDYWASSYFHRLHEGVQQELLEHGVLVVTFSLHGRAGEANFLDHLEPHEMDALILVRCQNTRVVHAITGKRIPHLLVSPHMTVKNAVTVLRDERRAAGDAINFLVEQGHRRIGIILREADRLESRARLDALKQAMAAHGLVVREAFIKSDCLASGGLTEAVLREYLTGPQRATAIVLTDMHGELTQTVAERLGLRVPHDLILLRYSEIHSAADHLPALELDSFDYGRAVGRFAYQLFCEDRDPYTPCTFLVPYQLRTASAVKRRPNGAGKPRRRSRGSSKR